MANAGRPTGWLAIMTDVVVSKLETAYSFGCSDVEACLFAGISRQTLWEYQQIHPEFSDRKAELKETPILLARQSVIKNLQNDGDLALRFLERRKKDEFSPRSEVDSTVEIKVTEERAAAVREAASK